MCSFSKYIYLPHGRSMEIPRERGVAKGKELKEKFVPELEFLGGGGEMGKPKKPSVEFGLYISLLQNSLHFFPLLLLLVLILVGVCLGCGKQNEINKNNKTR